MDRGTLGNIVVKLPMPLGNLPTLWNADGRFHEAYLTEFPSYYKTANTGYVDEDGYLFIMARTDDIINVAGHRLSTGVMEEAIAYHPDVAECAVIGIADRLKGQIPASFLVLNSGVERPDGDIEQEVVKLVCDQIGPVAAFKLALTVQRLPKTRSGKILRGTMQKIADGESWKMPATIDDPVILDEIIDALSVRGLMERSIAWRHLCDTVCHDISCTLSSACSFGTGEGRPGHWRNRGAVLGWNCLDQALGQAD